MNTNKVADYVTGGTMATSPAWMPSLATVNEWLSAISLVAGLVFMAWRCWQSIKANKQTGE